MGTLLDGDIRLGFRHCHLFPPLLGLMASRYRGGDAVIPAPGRRGFHPHDLPVVMVIFCLRNSYQARHL
jgi:hypothetical protein